MFKFASGLFLVGIALVPFSGSKSSLDGFAQGSTKAEGQSIYQIIASSGDRCTMMLHAIDGSASQMASPQADCASLDARVDAIRHWINNADGTVSLKDYADQEVARLEAFDSNTFKTADNNDLQLTVSRY